MDETSGAAYILFGPITMQTPLKLNLLLRAYLLIPLSPWLHTRAVFLLQCSPSIVAATPLAQISRKSQML